MMAVHFCEGEIASEADADRSDPSLTELFFFDLLARGHYVARRGMIAGSLVLGDAECEGLVSAVEGFLEERGDSARAATVKPYSAARLLWLRAAAAGLARERFTPEKAWAWHRQTSPFSSEPISSRRRPSINSRCGRRTPSIRETIDRELGWAAALGFNSMRVFLHHLLWERDREGFLERVEQFLDDRRPPRDRRDAGSLRRRLGPEPDASEDSARPGRTSTTPAGCRALGPRF